MSLTARWRWTICLAILSLACASLRAQDRAPFVRVDASGCDSGARRASGFVWRTTDSVVTALHVVAGCTDVAVRYPVGGQLRKARVLRVIQRFDLALLTVENPVPLTPLTSTAAIPPAGATLTAWGYPAPARGLLDTTFRRRATAGTLRDLLNDALRQEVESVGMPDLSSEILLLDNGTLLPGHSGAPLLDGAGRVAAIADGGLERGASQVSWAIPAARLQDLLDSSEVAAKNARRVGTLFSADSDFASPVSASASRQETEAGFAQSAAASACGYALVKVRTRTLQELVQTADDQMGLRQLIASGTGIVEMSDRFDVYQEVRSGATVVLPSGAVLQQRDGLCVTRGVSGDVAQWVQMSPVSSPSAAQDAAVAYERKLVDSLGPGMWQADPAWSYLAPSVRLDGLVALRRGNLKVIPTPFGPASDAYAFETLVTKGGMFMGVAAVRTGLTPQKVQRQFQCTADPEATGCEVLREELRQQGLAVIATHLSTFAVN